MISVEPLFVYCNECKEEFISITALQTHIEEEHRRNDINPRIIKTETIQYQQNINQQSQANNQNHMNQYSIKTEQLQSQSQQPQYHNEQQQQQSKLQMARNIVNAFSGRVTLQQVLEMDFQRIQRFHNEIAQRINQNESNEHQNSDINPRTSNNCNEYIQHQQNVTQSPSNNQTQINLYSIQSQQVQSHPQQAHYQHNQQQQQRKLQMARNIVNAYSGRVTLQQVLEMDFERVQNLHNEILQRLNQNQSNQSTKSEDIEMNEHQQCQENNENIINQNSLYTQQQPQFHQMPKFMQQAQIQQSQQSLASPTPASNQAININILDPNLAQTHPTLYNWTQGMRNAGYSNDQIQVYFQQQIAQQQQAQQQQEMKQEKSASHSIDNNDGSDNPIDILTVLLHQYPQIETWLQSMEYHDTVTTSKNHAVQFLTSLMDSQPQFTSLIKSIQHKLKQRRGAGEQKAVQSLIANLNTH